MLSGSLELAPGSVDLQPDPSSPLMLSRKAHLQQPCWPRPIDSLMALMVDFFVYHRLEKAVILLLVGQRVMAG